MPIIGDEKPFDPAPLLALGIPAVLWGGNHFADRLPASQSWLTWDKRCADYSNDQADCEMAWTNLGFPARMFRHVWNGMLRGSESKTPRVHPTQKPVALYKWIFENYARPGWKILDTHLGSGSSRIAAWDMGLDFYATELDPDYFEAMEKRFQAHIARPQLFAPSEQYQFKQASIFDAENLGI